MGDKHKHNTILQNGKNKFHIFTPQVIFLIIISVATSLLYVTAYFIDTNLSTTNEIIHYIIYWALASIANTLLLIAISANKYVFYVLFPLYNLVGTILSYAKIMYGAILTPMLIDASLHNDIQTTSDFFTVPAVLCIILWVITSTAFHNIQVKNNIRQTFNFSIGCHPAIHRMRPHYRWCKTLFARQISI